MKSKTTTLMIQMSSISCVNMSGGGGGSEVCVVPMAATAASDSAASSATSSVTSSSSTTVTATATATTSEGLTVVCSASAPLLSPSLQGPLPKMVAFDLDYTIWPRDCDKDVLAPFGSTVKEDGTTLVFDRWGRDASPYKNVADIIGALVDADVTIAYLSRNPSSGSVEQLLRRCPLNSARFPEKKTLWDALVSRDYYHAYSSMGYGRGKDKHFSNLKNSTTIEFSQIVFFDDLDENIKAANVQGSTAVLINRRTGLTWEALETGLDRWRAKQV